jgi:hypothetical protein
VDDFFVNGQLPADVVWSQRRIVRDMGFQAVTRPVDAATLLMPPGGTARFPDLSHARTEVGIQRQ